MVDRARNELTSRGLIAASDTVLFDQPGIQVYMTGNYGYEQYSTKYIFLEVIVINNPSYNLNISLDASSING